MDRKTPLYACHEALHGKIVSFAGFLLPVQYESGVIAEHMAVREHAGIFDVSHMGEALLFGRDAAKNLNALLTNRFDDMPVGKCRYGIMCYEDGGCVDDLIVCRLGEESFLIVMNASNTEKDVAHFQAHLSGEYRFEDISAETAQIALQGPAAKEILCQIADESSLPTKYYSFEPMILAAGARCLCSRTGYTGEFGYELYMAPCDAEKVWNALIEKGAVPCGLGARDTLRLEAAMPLYGHEISETLDPVTAGLSFAIKLDKDFIGCEALKAKGEPALKRVGIAVTGRGVVRENMALYQGGREVGFTTSGTFCPYVRQGCAMAYLPKELAAPDTAVEADVRGRMVPCKVVPLPFYSKTRKA